MHNRSPYHTDMNDFGKGVDYAISEISQFLASGQCRTAYGGGWSMRAYTNNEWFENEHDWYQENHYRRQNYQKTTYDGREKARRLFLNLNQRYEAEYFQKITTAFTPFFQEKARMQQEIDQLKHEVERLTVELKQRPTANSNNQFNK